MSSATEFSEPHVLVRAKRRLFQGSDDERSYAVVDTQFATDEWLHGEPISERVRDALAPFNHVRVGSGYPDLIGVRAFDSTLLAGEATDSPPLVAVEAKGETTAGGVDVERGVVQAHDRLQEVNVAYVAAPADAVSQSALTLARELNVGVLGVESDETVDVLELPRVVGNRDAGDANAVRFQATVQGVTENSLGLNHPKNYLGVPLALYHTNDTETILNTYVVGATADAQRGAESLGLVERRPAGLHLAPLGEEIVRFALDRHGSVEEALETFRGWQRSRTRFCELAPDWGRLARRVVWDYPATKWLIDQLQQIHDAGLTAPSLVDLVERAHDHHPTFTIELFIRGTTAARSRVLDEDGTLVSEALADRNVYHSPTVFQLKAMLFHAGIVSERGAEPHRLDPTTDVWKLRETL